MKVFGRQHDVEERFNDKNEELFEASYGAQFISGIIQPAMMFFGNLNYVAIALIGGLRVSSGQLTIGDIQAFIQYSRQFTQPLTQLASMINVMQSGIASAERVFELLDAEEESEDDAIPLEDLEPQGRVEFDHVSFSYDPENPLIEDLSLVAEPGQTVAIVGPTGAGKTTLVNLIMRFYDIDDGAITLDGIDISKMRRRDLRSNMGMVLQDTWLFGGTIRENIAYGNLDATEEQILAAARATYVDRFVHSLPHGYDTVIDDEGGSVSAGEKQLLTIARAFLADPTILILDEATSSVDTRTEVLIQRAMAALRSNRTSFVIAHRLSTIRDADMILVMEHGQIVEQGIARGAARGATAPTRASTTRSSPRPRSRSPDLVRGRVGPGLELRRVRRGDLRPLRRGLDRALRLRGRVLGVVVVVPGRALLELVLRLAERARQLRQLGAAEDHEHHHQDDEQFRHTYVHDSPRTRHLVPLPVPHPAAGRRPRLRPGYCVSGRASKNARTDVILPSRTRYQPAHGIEPAGVVVTRS